MNLKRISPLTEKRISIWVQIQERIWEDERQKEKGPVQMRCVEEHPSKRQF